MSVNYYRALTLVCTIIVCALSGLAGFMINESARAYPGRVLPMGEWLVPGILIMAALPLTLLLVNRIVPRTVSDENQIGTLIIRVALVMLVIAVFAAGFLL